MWASLVGQMVKNLAAIQETQVQSLGWEDIPGEVNDYSLQYSCLENFMDRGIWQAIVQGITKRQTRLSDSHTHCVIWLKVNSSWK